MLGTFLPVRAASAADVEHVCSAYTSGFDAPSVRDAGTYAVCSSALGPVELNVYLFDDPGSAERVFAEAFAQMEGALCPGGAGRPAQPPTVERDVIPGDGSFSTDASYTAYGCDRPRSVAKIGEWLVEGFGDEATATSYPADVEDAVQQIAANILGVSAGAPGGSEQSDEPSTGQVVAGWALVFLVLGAVTLLIRRFHRRRRTSRAPRSMADAVSEPPAGHQVPPSAPEVPPRAPEATPSGRPLPDRPTASGGDDARWWND